MEGGITGKGWKPGQSGNPRGRVKAETLDLLKEGRDKLTKTLHELITKPVSELKSIGEDSSQSGINGLCARIIYQAWNKADPIRAEWIVRHLCLPLPTKLELGGEDGAEIPKVVVEVVDYRNARKDLPNPETK